MTLLAGEDTTYLHQVSASRVRWSLAKLFRLLELLVSFGESVEIGIRSASQGSRSQRQVRLFGR